METKRIVVIGGTGYIGTVLVDALQKKGYRVTVLSRKLPKVGSKKKVRYLQCDVLNKGLLSETLKNFDLVIYLAAVIKTFNKTKYKENVCGLQNTFDAMYHHNIHKILYFSTQNVYLKRTGPYGNSKKRCEKMLRDSSLDYIILKPNYVYGIDSHNYFYTIYKIMEKLKISLLIGDGETKIQPVNKDDLVLITLGQLLKWKSKDEVNVSGRTTLTLNQVAAIIKEQANFKCVRIHVPTWIFRLGKWVVPFDVEGLTDSRVPPPGSKIMYGRADIKEDIKKIIALDKPQSQ